MTYTTVDAYWYLGLLFLFWVAVTLMYLDYKRKLEKFRSCKHDYIEYRICSICGHRQKKLSKNKGE